MVEQGSETDTHRSEADQTSGAVDLEALRAQGAVLKELLTFLAQNLVTNPGAVEVTQGESNDSAVLELHVDKQDLGRVIGKQGRTAKSLRTILNAAASRANTKVVLEIVED